MRLADAHSDPLYSSFHAARNYCEFGSRFHAAFLGNGTGDGVFGIVLDGRGQLEHVTVDGGNGHLSSRDRAGFIHHNGVDLARRLQDFRALNDKPELCAAAGADEDSGGRRQAHGAWAGHNENGYGGDKGRGYPAEEEMNNQRKRSYRNHHRDEDLRDAVHEALHWCLGGLGICDELGHLGQYRILAHLGGSHLNAARSVDGCTSDRIAGTHLNGYWLAGNHGRIDGRVARLHDAIGGDLFAWADYEDIAYLQLCNRDAPLALCGKYRGFLSS